MVMLERDDANNAINPMTLYSTTRIASMEYTTLLANDNGTPLSSYPPAVTRGHVRRGVQQVVQPLRTFDHHPNLVPTLRSHEQANDSAYQLDEINDSMLRRFLQSNDSPSTSGFGTVIVFFVVIIIVCLAWGPRYIRRCHRQSNARNLARTRETRPDDNFGQDYSVVEENVRNMMNNMMALGQEAQARMSSSERREYISNVLTTKKVVRQGSQDDDGTADPQSKSNLVIAAASDDANGGDDDEQAEQCAICLLDYEEGDEVCWSHNSQCGHAFHKTCISEWLLSHDECPCCRHNYLSFDGGSNDEGGNADADEQGRLRANPVPPINANAEPVRIDPGTPLFMDPRYRLWSWNPTVTARAGIEMSSTEGRSQGQGTANTTTTAAATNPVATATAVVLDSGEAENRDDPEIVVLAENATEGEQTLGGESNTAVVDVVAAVPSTVSQDHVDATSARPGPDGATAAE